MQAITASRILYWYVTYFLCSEYVWFCVPFSLLNSSFQKQSDDMIDTYYKTMGELHFEPRARPSDRTKTPEEIAQEEREALEELEVF